MKLPSQRPGRARALLVAAVALVVWVGVAARAAQVFAPDSVYVQPFNSDSALPVLMANDPVLDTFRTYNYAQDQIGAYPFIFCQLIARATGFVWTDRSIYRLQLCWLFLSLPVIAALSQRTRFVAPALFLVVLCLHPTVSHYVFVLNQRYAWQITPLFFGWWSLRRLCARLHGSTEGARASNALSHTPDVWHTPDALWYVSAFFFSFLAIWVSPLSAPMLLVFLSLEVARARLLATDATPSHTTSTTHATSVTRSHTPSQADSRAPRLRAVRLLACALPLLAAVVVVQLLKANYHRHALKHFGTDFRTPTQIDWGYLSINLRAQLANLTATPAWWLIIPALVVAPFIVAELLRRLDTRDTRARVRLARGDAHAATRVTLAGARLDAGVLLLGSLVVALVNFVGAFAFMWIRMNLYGGRYLALTHLFGAFAGLLALFLVSTLPARVYNARRVVFPALAFLIALVLALKFPPALKNPEYATLTEAATGLAQRNPRAVLLGGYWDTYVFAALRPADSFTPVPAEDQLVRTPWTPRALRESSEVVVVHHYFPYSGGMEVPAPYTTFGDGQNPPPVIKQHGATLQLETPRWYEHGGYVFSLYRNVTDRAAH
jgi:hypothetical protein